MRLVVKEWTGDMKFEGQLEGRELVPRAPRTDTGFVVVLRCAAGEFPARVTNLSASGFRLSSAQPLQAGWEVSLEVLKRTPVKCVIRWAAGYDAGGVFLESVAL